jgi:hypothetical protein
MPRRNKNAEGDRRMMGTKQKGHPRARHGGLESKPARQTRKTARGGAA